MSHTNVEVFDFLLYTLYPVAGIFAVEIIARVTKTPTWLKLWIQGIVSVGFGISYLVLPGDEKLPLTAVVLFALAIALFYQGRRAKIFPNKPTF